MPTTPPGSDAAARKAVLKRLRSHKTAVADLPEAVREAKRLGIEITTIAEVAGIARTRVYRILDFDSGGYTPGVSYVKASEVGPVISPEMIRSIAKPEIEEPS